MFLILTSGTVLLIGKMGFLSLTIFFSGTKSSLGNVFCYMLLAVGLVATTRRFRLENEGHSGRVMSPYQLFLHS